MDRWQNGDGGMWLKSMPPTSSPEIAVYSFEHNIKPDDSFSWNSVFESGDRLFRELTELTGKDVCFALDRSVAVTIFCFCEKLLT